MYFSSQLQSNTISKNGYSIGVNLISDTTSSSCNSMFSSGVFGFTPTGNVAPHISLTITCISAMELRWLAIAHSGLIILSLTSSKFLILAKSSPKAFSNLSLLQLCSSVSKTITEKTDLLFCYLNSEIVFHKRLRPVVEEMRFIFTMRIISVQVRRYYRYMNLEEVFETLMEGTEINGGSNPNLQQHYYTEISNINVV